MDEFINELRRKYSNQIISFNSFKDLENSSGRQIREMMAVKEPPKNIIPESVRNVVERNIEQINHNYNVFIEAFRTFIPDINSL